MNTKKKLLFLFLGLLLTFLLPTISFATLDIANIPVGALTHNGTRSNICYKNKNGQFIKLNIARKLLKNRALQNDNEYYVSGKCNQSNQTPALECPNGQVLINGGVSCAAPITGNPDAPTILDVNGALLNFSEPQLLSGTAKSVGAVYKYTNVTTLNGVQVDALVKIEKSVNGGSVDTMDDPAPNAKNPYPVTSGISVPDYAFFAPRIKTTSANGYVDFYIAFQDTSGNPVTLQNVYLNSIDIDGPEFVEYGGFYDFTLCSKNCVIDPTKAASGTNIVTPTHLQYVLGTGGNGSQIRITGTGNYNGLILNDAGRIQAKFHSITNITMSMGTTTAASGALGNTADTLALFNAGTLRASYGRQFGSMFVKHDIGSPITHTPPTVDFQVTTVTKPPITGGVGSSTTIPSVVVKDSTGAIKASGAGVVTGATWTFTPSTALLPGVYNVFATGGNGLVDQTDGELTILLSCASPLILNAAGTACESVAVCTGNTVLDTVTNTCIPSTVVCTSPQVLNNVTGICETPAPTCTAPQILDTTTNTCKTPNTACEALTNPLPATMPEGAEYDSKKVTICHFPPGNPSNVHTISISLNALAAHVGKHGDTIWQSGKLCPKTPDDCPPPPPPTPAVPTVDSQTVKYGTTPIVITGTIGNTGMANGESFRVTVNGVVYPWDTAGNSGNVKNNSVVIIGTQWILNVTNIIPIGIYDVKADRGTKSGSAFGTVTSTDATVGELTVIPASCPAGQGFVNNVCVPLPTVTVNTQTTTDTTPTITGTVGNISLAANEVFAVVVNGKLYTNGDGNLSVSGMNWTLQIPNANAISPGLYDVAGTRDNGLPDTTEDELRIDPICTSAQVLVNHVCIDAPTVVSQTTFDTTPTITGTVGATALGATEAFSVTVNGVIYAKGNANLTISGTAWTLNIPTALAINTYNVDALRAGTVPDPTSGELIIQFNCAAPKYINSSGACVDEPVCATGQTLTNHICVDPVCTTGQVLVNHQCTNLVAPTVEAKTTTEGTPVPLTGAPGSSLTISSVTLTKTLDGLGAAIVGSPVTVGSNITSSITSWTTPTPSPLNETVGTYTITATDGNGKTGTNTLIVTCPTEKETTATSCADKVIPTVDTKTTTDKIAPILTGSVGSSKSLTITIKSTPQVSGAATISGTTWTFTSPSKIAAGNYDVEALGETGLKDATTNELTVTTCTLPKVFNSAGTECIEPIPTVIPVTTDSGTPTITGTVGIVELGSTEMFSVAVNGKTYNKSVAVAENLSFPDNLFAFLKNAMIKSANAVVTNALTVSGLNWTLVIPATDKIPAGIYDVDAIRNTTSKDVTSKELTINLTCAAPQIFNATKTACILPVIPTVNNSTTTDKIAPTLTGNVGSSSSLTITVSDSTGTKATGAATITGTTWIYTPSAPIAKGVYDVEAKGETGLVDVTENELTVTMECTLPKVANAAGTACINPIPTVVSLNTPDTTPTLTGTVGTTELTTNETFSVTVDGQIHNRNSSNLTISGTDWILAITTEIKPGIYDVDAIRQGTYDETSGELEITDNITICENKQTKSILKSQWDGTKEGANYYLGECVDDHTPPPPSLKPCSDYPGTPQNLDPEKTVEQNPMCDDGGQRVKVDATNVTVKRATIINGITKNGIVGSLNNKMITYGEKASMNGNMAISNAEISNTSGTIVSANDCSSNDAGGSTQIVDKEITATGVTLTNVTITNAYVDISGDFETSTGLFSPSDSWIEVKEGVTSPTDQALQDWKSTIIKGVITNGVDTNGNPIRGSMDRSFYDKDVTNPERITKARRVIGNLTNATINNATTKTRGGKTFVVAGTIVSGTFEGNNTAYGTVVNGMVIGANASPNHCFSSGTVGNKGQLNWKEVINK